MHRDDGGGRLVPRYGPARGVNGYCKKVTWNMYLPMHSSIASSLSVWALAHVLIGSMNRRSKPQRGDWTQQRDTKRSKVQKQ